MLLTIDEALEDPQFCAFLDTNNFEEAYWMLEYEERGILYDILLKEGLNPLENIDYLGRDLFGSSKGMTNLTIPDNVEDIGAVAFNSCDDIENVLISGSVKAIGNSAFAHCANLKSVIISEGNISIGDYCFDYCFNMREIKIPSSTEYFGLDCIPLFVKIKCYKDSFAEHWANEYGYETILI